MNNKQKLDKDQKPIDYGYLVDEFNEIKHQSHIDPDQFQIHQQSMSQSNEKVRNVSQSPDKFVNLRQSMISSQKSIGCIEDD